MGTSTNRRGLSPSTPLLPDWINEFEENQPTDSDENESNEPTPVEDDGSPDDIPIPHNRFDASQRGFKEAIRTGNSQGLNRVVKNYYYHSLGGSKKAAQRMQLSSQAVARLGSTLSRFQKEGLQDVLNTYNLTQYVGRPAVEILSALMDIVCETSALLDNAITKYAYARAVVRIIEENPELDLTRLTDTQIAEMMAIFLEESLVYRLICDVGRSLTVATSDPLRALEVEKQLSQIVSGLIRSTIMPELQKAVQSIATIERKLTGIYRIAIQTILNS
ncbi:hypothetical protein BWI97_25750 [Siphonobacter sp. BAB-5405]|uniref:Qat anti-phage system associated protein QatB n=1 Tax=Siphonobacter sp. BAB-5405 TaxID=1864825 RepID=UPI000C80D077|nr:Qat anti-phage system associated protein QatB [Siphonobacter sp. BAB-5405]PMD87483.1 hypothetical protein BWI97_25750 [Siphonobacter sp. BAB-5405]